MIPVAITAYQRPEKLFKIIEKCITNKIYVALDYPKINFKKHQDINLLYKNYNTIKSFLKTANIYNEKEIVFLENQKVNLGISDNLILMLENIFKVEDNIIILEDDILPSEAFFYYINKLFSYNFPIIGWNNSYSDYFNGTFFKRTAMDGYGTWWGVCINKDFFLKSREFFLKLKDRSYHANFFKDLFAKDKEFFACHPTSDISFIEKIYNRNHNSVDFYTSVYCRANNIPILTPTVSLVSPSEHYSLYNYENKNTSIITQNEYIEVVKYNKQYKII